MKYFKKEVVVLRLDVFGAFFCGKDEYVVEELALQNAPLTKLPMDKREWHKISEVINTTF